MRRIISRITKRAAWTTFTTTVAGLIPWQLLHIWRQLESIDEQKADNPLRDAVDQRLSMFGPHSR